MTTPALAKKTTNIPSFFGSMDEFFKPWNEWFGQEPRSAYWPAVNITENKDVFEVALAVPGMKKEDFRIDIEGNMLSISSEKEESMEEKEKKFTRKEYSYSSFNRSFTLPDEINREKIEATYVDGVLKLMLPRKEEAKKTTAKHIAVK